MKLNICLLSITAILSCCNANGQGKKTIIEIEPLSRYKNDTVEIRTTASVYLKDIKPINKNELKLSSGIFKFTSVLMQPVLAGGLPFLSNWKLFLLEPGDSIRIKFINDEPVFSGKGSEKMELQYQIDAISNKISKPKNDKYTRVDSVGDYLEYYHWQNEILNKQLQFLETYRKTISSFAYTYLKYNCIDLCRFYIGQKFIGITSVRKRKLFGHSSSDLVSIFDSTLLKFKPGNEYDSDIIASSLGYDFRIYVGLEISRANEFNYSEESDLQRHTREYYYFKDRLKGLAREKACAALLTSSMLRKDGVNAETIDLVNDYLKISGYPEYKEYVKHYLDVKMALSKGMQAPDFNLTDIKGDQLSLHDLKGKVVIMDFWFTGCIGCVQMVPVLRKVEEAFNKNSNVVFLSISIDGEKEQWANSVQKKKYTTGTGINLYTGDKGKNHPVIRSYNVTAYPALFMIAPDGKFSGTTPDPRKDEGKALIALIKKALAEQNDGPYVFYNNQQVISKTIIYSNGTQISKTDKVASSYKQNIMLTVSTDDPYKTLSLNLRKELKEEPTEYAKPSKLLAISDIEGNFDSFRKLLQSNGVIDENYNWIFNDGHLVLYGDFFDRGQQVTEVLWLVYSLEEKAKAKGGYVHFILGNHEIMNLSGDLRYVVPKYIEGSTKLINENYYSLYGKESELGRWLRTKNIIEKIGSILFVHGGISAEINNLPLTLSEINRISRPYYDDMDKARKSIDPNLKMLFNYDFSPFWYRAYYKRINPYFDSITQRVVYYQAGIDEIDSTLTKFQAERIVTGHTIVADTVSMWHGGKVFNTDTPHAEGKSEALLIENNKFYRVNTEGKKVLLFIDDKRPPSPLERAN